MQENESLAEQQDQSAASIQNFDRLSKIQAIYSGNRHLTIEEEKGTYENSMSTTVHHFLDSETVENE